MGKSPISSHQPGRIRLLEVFVTFAFIQRKHGWMVIGVAGNHDEVFEPIHEHTRCVHSLNVHSSFPSFHQSENTQLSSVVRKLFLCPGFI